MMVPRRTALLRAERGQLLAQLHRMLHVAAGARHRLIEEARILAIARIHPQRPGGALPERTDRCLVVGGAGRIIEIDLNKLAVAHGRARHIGMARPAGTQHAHLRRERMREEGGERIARRLLSDN
jgi:hypothetical protein